MSEKLISFSQLQAKLGNRSRSSIYRDIEEKRIPKPMKLGMKLYWNETQIDELIQKLQEERAA